MQQVVAVVCGQPFDRIGLGSAGIALSLSGLLGGIRQYPADMPVQQDPQGGEILGGIMLVIGDPHPLILVVDDGGNIFILGGDKTADIVLRRVDQVAEDLFPAPFFRFRLVGKYLFRDSRQPAGIIYQDLPEVVRDGL